MTVVIWVQLFRRKLGATISLIHALSASPKQLDENTKINLTMYIYVIYIK